MIRVLLVDDHEMVRLGVSSYLSIQSDVEVVGEAENGEDGYEKAMALRPDVILMDLVMEVHRINQENSKRVARSKNLNRNQFY